MVVWHEVRSQLVTRSLAQCVSAGLIDGSKIYVDSSLVDPNASLNSVRELDPATLDQIHRVCIEQTDKLEGVDCQQQSDTDDEQKPDLPRPGSRTEVNQKYQSSNLPLPSMDQPY